MKQGLNAMGRRTVARMAMAGFLGLALVACGSDDANDDGSGRDAQGAQNLRYTYDRVVGGMSREQVVSLVGVAPHGEFSRPRYDSNGRVTSYVSAIVWSDYSGEKVESLTVWFGGSIGATTGAIRAEWTQEGASVQRLEKDF